MAAPVQRQSWTATADYNAILHMDRDGDGDDRDDGDGDDVMLGMCRQFGIPYSTRLGAFSSRDYDDGDNKISKQDHVFIISQSVECLTANLPIMVAFSAKQFKNFSCLTETEARNMNRLLNCFVEGGPRNISNKRKYRTGDEEGRGKVGKKSDLKRKKSWSAQQEYIWKLTTKLPKLCRRLKKDF